MARLTKAILATSPNVVKLPTAASRQVNNNRFAEQRAAKAAVRKVQPWPGESLRRGGWQAVEQAKTFDSLEQSPALVLAMMIARALPSEIREKVVSDLAAGASINEDAKGALSAVKFATMTVGDVCDLDAARAYLDRQEGR